MGTRVAHVVPTDRIAHLLLRRRLGHLAAAGYEVHVLCGRAPDSSAGGRDGVDYEASLRGQGLQVHYLPFEREIRPVVDARCAAALHRALRAGGYAIAHSHNPKGGLLGPPAARLADVPHVLHTVHGFLFHDRITGLHRMAALAAERWTAGWCHHLLFQSEEDAAYARQHRFKSDNRLHHVGNGVDESCFEPDVGGPAGRQLRAQLGWADGDLVVGTVGRVVAEKGYHEFFEMAGQLAASRDDVRFLVVGLFEPEQSDAVDPHALARRRGIEDRCAIVEGRDDMPALYAAMDVFVLASHREGLSRSLMEAMSMARPVVTCDIRGCRELVADGVSGRLVPVRDPAVLTATVADLLLDSPRRQRLGAAARERILARYTEAAVAGRVAGVYEAVLGGAVS